MKLKKPMIHEETLEKGCRKVSHKSESRKLESQKGGKSELIQKIKIILNEI